MNRRLEASDAADTVERLRSDIDNGRTGDKVPFPDAAAAPLGSDEEAAGTPVAPADVAASRRLETARPSHKSPRNGPGHAWVLIGVIALIAVAVAVWGISVA